MISFKKFLTTQDNGLMSWTAKDTVPGPINGIPFKKVTPSNWSQYTKKINESQMMVKPGFKTGSGCIIRESDGRIWVVHPTNQFGGYEATFPKGTLEAGLTLQENAIKETWEESGLLVKITGFAVDVQRTTSVARYYFAVRVGGSPTGMGWESEKVSLVPKNMLNKIVNHPADKPILAAI